MKNIKSFLKVLNKLNGILDKKQRLRGLKILFWMFVSSIFELVGIAVMTPFVNALLDPNALMENRWVIYAAQMLGLKSYVGFLAVLVIGVVIIYIVKNILLIYSRSVQVAYQCQVEEELSLTMLRSYLNKPYSYYVQTNSSDIRHGVIEDISKIYDILQVVFQLMAESITVLFIIVYIIQQDWFMAVGITIAAGLTVIVLALGFKNILKHTGEQYRVQDLARNRNILQISQGIMDIFVMQRKEAFYDKYKVSYDEYRKAKITYSVVGACPERIIETIFIASICLIVFLRIGQGIDAMEFVPQLGALAMAAYRLLPSINKFSNGINAIVFYQPSVDAAYENISSARRDFQMDAESQKSDKCRLSFQDKIDVRNILWQYDRAERKILDKASLEIKKGDSVAIIGESGSGKTTLADILLGLYKPEEGEVLVDGQEIYLNLKQWAQIISFVPQNVYLLDDTIRENIVFGQSKADDNRIWDALEQAQLKDFVRNLPEGLDTVVGEAGIRFSGGQRQRIAIARALYSQPDILLLDEATAALDNDTEAAVMEAIDSLKGKKTLIIIAHRLSTIKNCNKVYEVKNGKIIDVSGN